MTLQDSTGNIGIGTTNPSQKLEVNGRVLGTRIQSTLSTTGASDVSYSLGSNTGLGIFTTGTNLLSFATSSTERMTIDSNGLIGINTNGPDRRLDVLDASNPQLRLTQADGTVYSDFQMNSSGDLVVNVDGATNQLVLDNGGSVGIGNAAPVATLDITGTASISGALTIGSTGVIRSAYDNLTLQYKSGLEIGRAPCRERV